MEWNKGNYQVSTERKYLQVERIHRFLSNEAYWCMGIPLKLLQKAIEASLCFGLFEVQGKKYSQVGFARIVTDSATFAWLCDVYVEKEHRGKGLAKWLVECSLSHSAVKNLRRICLATRDAEGLYEKFGFKPLAPTTKWLEIKDNEVYRTLK